VDNDHDYNKDKLVDPNDQLIARNNPISPFSPVRKINISPPQLSAALSNDTGPGGVPNGDGITQDPQIDGNLTAAHPIASFLAGLNAGPVTTDVLGLVQPGGDFTISESLLQSINGGTLPDGPYTLHLRAEDSSGLVSVHDVPFAIKRSIVTPQLPDLIAASDSGASDTDNITNDDTPTIDVTAELGSTVTLFVDGSPVGQQTAGPVAQFTLGSLGDGTYSVTASAVDGAGNVSSLSGAMSLTIQTVAPNVVVSTVVTFSDDLTPHVTVAADGDLGLADGTQVVLDVDINNDGDFDDAGELGRTLTTLYNGGSYFELTPALPATDPVDGPYLVQLRARVSDVAGNEGTSPLSSLKIDTLSSSALYDCVNAVDPSFSWSQVYSSAGAGYTYYVLNMRSQTWRLGDVNDPYWDHWVKIVVPTGAIADSALLYITGGDNGDSLPTSPNGDMVNLALATGAVTVELRIVPNEEVFFFAEPDMPFRDEDEIIAYTFDQFVNNIGAPGNETWPLLLPMVKSAVAAMDATQAFVPTVTSGQTIDDFVVTGYSKRGWTTWLTGAVDTRVKAIIPGVIDLLNMDESMIHHYGFYDGAFSGQVQDYQDFDLIQNSAVEANQELGRIVDPYRYLFNGNLTNIPKLLLNSTGDEFFVPDSGQFYLHDLPGTSYVRYIPNTGHGLNGDAGDSTLTFFDAYLNNRTLPEFSWTAEQNGSLHVQTVTTPTTVKLWQATNPSARDFRKGYNPGIIWTSTTLTDQGGGVYIGDVPVPASGATAFVVELTFPSAIPGVPYVFTTEVRVTSANGYELTPWDFYMPTNGGVPTVVTAASATTTSPTGEDDNAVVVGLAVAVATRSISAADSPVASSTTPAELAPLTVDDAAELMFAELSWLDDEADDSGEPDEDDTLDVAIIGLEDALAE
jgi:PhoPQ-activated pathogenicity-related protein